MEKEVKVKTDSEDLEQIPEDDEYIKEVSLVKEAQKVYGAKNNVYILLKDGNVLTAGDNTHGQLGQNNNESSNYAIQNPLLKNITDMAVGEDWYLALNKGGYVWAGGNNTYGQLGIGQSGEDKLIAYRMEIFDVIEIKAGKTHATMLMSDGSVWTVGANDQGQLGNNKQENISIPEQVKNTAGTDNLYEIITLGTTENSSYALSEKGKVYSWGANTQGELGIGNTQNKKIPVEVKARINGRANSELDNTIEKISTGTANTVYFTNIKGQVYGLGKEDKYKDLDNILEQFKSPIIQNLSLIDTYLDDYEKKFTIRYTVGSDEKTLDGKELNDFKEKFIEFIRQNGLEIVE